ncbi:MAG: glycosyltransferase [Burkholderiales bacterium]|nr:glycosyltransferase [Burkholderiales bacterium]
MTYPAHGTLARSEIATQDAVAVSIIIPAFNAADSIGRCIDSVLRQSFGDVEIVVIDDGSMDDTARRVVDLIQANPSANIRVARQSNLGVSVARNHGLRLARGRYIMFIDADDVLADGAIGALWQRAEADQLEVLLANAWWHDLAGNLPRLMLPDAGDWTAWSAGRIGTGPDWIVQQVAARRMKHYVWCQFVRRDWLLATGERFVPGITHQDIVWTHAVLGRARRVGYMVQPVYHYHQRPGSLSQPSDSGARLRTARHYMRVTQALDALARTTRHGPLAAAHAWQAVEEGIAVLHAARRLAPADREALFRLVQSGGHIPLLLRNALTPGHRIRVLKRAARYFAWRAGEALRQWLRPTPVVAAHRNAAQVINSQFGAD